MFSKMFPSREFCFFCRLLLCPHRRHPPPGPPVHHEELFRLLFERVRLRHEALDTHAVRGEDHQGENGADHTERCRYLHQRGQARLWESHVQGQYVPLYEQGAGGGEKRFADPGRTGNFGEWTIEKKCK